MSSPKRAGYVIWMSILTGILYSIFEDIYYYQTSPLYSPYGASEIAVKNLTLFLGIGLLAYALFSLFGRITGKILAIRVPLVFAALTCVPIFFFLFSSLRATAFIYNLLSGLSGVVFLSVSVTFLTFFLLSRYLAKSHPETFMRLAGPIFFFINIGSPSIEWRAMVRGEWSGFPSLFLYLSMTIGLYFIVLLSQRAFSRVSLYTRLPAFKPVRWSLIVMIGTLLTLWVTSDHSSEPNGSHGTFEQPNILLLVLDTARADRFSCYGYERDTTPFLKSFSEDAVIYHEAISPAVWTLPSHASLFTGLYPSAHGLLKSYHLKDHFFTLSEFLRSKGYLTAGFSNNPFVSRENGMAQGFEIYVEMWKRDVIYSTLYSQIEWFLRRNHGFVDGGSERTVQMVMEWFNRVYPGERPFFLFINLMESHLGFDAPETYHRRFLRKDYSSRPLEIKEQDFRYIIGIEKMTEDEWRDFGDIYDGDLYYLDRKIEELFGFLEKNSYLDNTIVVITSDHGEHLGEHQLMGHSHSLYEPLLKVPLIIKMPGGLPGLPGDFGPVQTVDIFPTLLDLLGNEYWPADYPIQGISLFQLHESPRNYTISEFDLMPEKGKITKLLKTHPENKDILKYDRALKAIRSDSIKFIWSSNGDSELYDLSEDPGEFSNIRYEREEDSAVLEQQLFDWLNSFEHESVEGEMGVDDVTRQKLKALGYID